MRALWIAVTVAVLAATGTAAPSAALPGYGSAESESERRSESLFIDIPSAQSALETVTVVAARPHAAGSRGDYALAIWLRDRLRAAGLNAELQPFGATVDTPRTLRLELAPPDDEAPPANPRHRRRAPAFPVVLDLADRGVAGDGDGLPFEAGSGDGDVSAPLVYAGRGRTDDYAVLARARVDVRGAVVLVRAGAGGRGAAAELAQARAAAGVLFFNDPADDGAGRGLTFPDGPWRPASSVERGWIGVPLNIPVLPISAANAAPLLASLRGVPGPAGWGGALPVNYPLARGPGRVHLVVKLDRRSTTLWNTVATIPGVRGDQSVVVGAYRDAWDRGAGQDGAGIATLVEVARGLGFMLHGNWRPQRTIVIAGWDGGEIGAVGARAYVGAHRVELARGCFGYLNADTAVSGPTLAVTGSAAIASIAADAGRRLPDPRTFAAPDEHPGGPAAPEGDGAPFLDLTVPIASVSLRGPFGVANSADDTLAFATRWSDPDFHLHRAAAQLYGIAALRLADASGSPYSFSGYAAVLRGGIDGLLKRAAPQSGIRIDAGALRRALGRFASAAAVYDRSSPPRPSDALTARALDAVHGLDALAYGTAGPGRTTFADVVSARATGDPALTQAALRRAISALDRAAANLLF